MGRNSLDISEEELVEALKKTKTQSQAGELLGISQASVSNYMREFNISPKKLMNTPIIRAHQSPNLSYEELIQILVQAQEEEEPTVGYNEVDISIETDRNIAIFPTADWHIGARWVDYKRLIQMIEDIVNQPYAYTLLCGDFCDNYNQTAYRGGQVEEKIPIQWQKYAAEVFIKRLAPKGLGIINGCHDEWSWFNDGFDFAKYLASKGDCYYLGHNGYINLKVNDIDYRIFMTHNTYRNSTINEGHGLRSALKEHGDFDVGVCAHAHKPFVETFVLRGEKKWIMRCGAFKGQDRHASKGGFPPTYECTPGFILNHDKKDVIMDIDYTKLLEYL